MENKIITQRSCPLVVVLCPYSCGSIWLSRLRNSQAIVLMESDCQDARYCQKWWSTPLIPAPERQRHMDLC